MSDAKPLLQDTQAVNGTMIGRDSAKKRMLYILVIHCGAILVGALVTEPSIRPA